MRIKVDMSDFVTERVLSMKCKNVWWRFIAYISKSLNRMERNYEIYNKKILVVIRELEN